MTARDGAQIPTQATEAWVGQPAATLTVIHEMERPDSKFIEAVSGGWPMTLSGKNIRFTQTANGRTMLLSDSCRRCGGVL